ncbi:hypothetical protein, partial [Streptomyces sp. NPDC006645]|uniref:hypothetical protein n=1 Tax=Streptomyces sp. NPDC006645 TaxID=3157184 RepID=UPI0033A6ECE0
NPDHEVTVALVGKYIDLPDAYLSVTEALRTDPAWSGVRQGALSEICVGLDRPQALWRVRGR